jgi:hypothetical protein
MERRVYLLPKGDFHFFTNLYKESSYFCITKETWNEFEPIFGSENGPYTLPDNVLVPAFILTKVKQDQMYDYYDIVDDNPVQFMVNKIKWINVFNDKYLK